MGGMTIFAVKAAVDLMTGGTIRVPYIFHPPLCEAVMCYNRTSRPPKTNRSSDGGTFRRHCRCTPTTPGRQKCRYGCCCAR